MQIDDPHRSKRSAGQGWLSTMLGILVLVAAGFGLGLVVGVVSEEPELVVGHMAGRSDEIDWTDDNGTSPPVFAAVHPTDPSGASREAGSARNDGVAGRPASGPQLGELAPRVSAPPPVLGEHSDGPDVPEGWIPTTESAPDGPSARAAGASSGHGEADTHRGEPSRSETAAVALPNFEIQVGAFGTGESAEQVANELRRKGYPVRVLRPELDDRWRVRVGPIVGRVEADRIAERLKVEEQLPTWVLRERGS
jgi:cell division septation protein DedD